MQKAGKVKTAVLYAAMFIITFLLVEVICSAMLLYRYRALGAIPYFNGEPALSVALITKRAVASVTANSPSEAPAYPGLPQLKKKHEVKTPLVNNPYNIVSSPYPFFAADSAFGYAPKPGRYEFTYQKKLGDFYKFYKNKVTVNPDHSRYTGRTPSNADGKIYVFGDSFIFGEGINDEQTFSYLLQSTQDKQAVHLYAAGGYSITQAYIRFLKIARSLTANDTLIIGYADYYKKRDAAAPSRLREYGEPWEMMLDDKINHAKAELLKDGKIQVSYTPLFCKYNPAYCQSEDPSPAEFDQLTSSMINAIADHTPAKILLLHFEGPDEDKALSMLSKKVTIIPATLDDFDYEIRDDIMGFDGHPGPFWHYAMFKRILPYLSHK